MDEKKLSKAFRRKIKKQFPEAYCYEILESLRPFHYLVIHHGIPFTITFRVRGRKPTEFQKCSLAKAKKAGATAWVLTDKDNLDTKLGVMDMIAKSKRKLYMQQYRWWEKTHFKEMIYYEKIRRQEELKNL